MKKIFTPTTVFLIIVFVTFISICYGVQLKYEKDKLSESIEKALSDTIPSLTAYTDSLLAHDSILHPLPGQWTIDSISAYIDKMNRCRQLEDSERDLALLVAEGRASQKEYNRAYRIYSNYFKNVYEPAYRRVCFHAADTAERREGR